MTHAAADTPQHASVNDRLRDLALRTARLLRYDVTHITRTVAYGAIDAALDAMPVAEMDALEIAAGWKWRERPWRSFTEMNWPDHDICRDTLDQRFDIIIADNVWEHLLHPWRATHHVLEMLKPGGLFINITPFMIRHHPIPHDCTRWTELGMRHFLADCGFDEATITTGAWGNASAVKANLHRWARTGWKRKLPNHPDFPITVWAFARKPM